MQNKKKNNEIDDNKARGYIKLFRSAFENEFFNSEKYNHFQAFFYLVASANVENGERVINNKRKFIKRGQVWTSIRFLAKKWKLNERTVISYLELFKNRSMITFELSKIGTVITIVKYGFYNDIFKNDTAVKYSSDYISEYSSEYSSDYNKDKNVLRMYQECNKNEQEEIEAAPPTFSPWGEELE